MFNTIERNDQLSEDLLDACLMQSTPTYTNTSSVDTFCIVLSFVKDVSCVRAYVERFVDMLENDADIKSNVQCKLFIEQIVSD